MSDYFKYIPDDFKQPQYSVGFKSFATVIDDDGDQYWDDTNALHIFYTLIGAMEWHSHLPDALCPMDDASIPNGVDMCMNHFHQRTPDSLYISPNFPSEWMEYGSDYDHTYWDNLV